MEKNRMYDTAKNLIKYRLRSVVTNQSVKNNKNGGRVEVDISDMNQLKSATRESVMSSQDLQENVKKEIKEEFEYIVGNFDFIYNDAYLELLSEFEKSKTLVVSEEENKLDENMKKVEKSSRKLADLTCKMNEHGKEDLKSAQKTIEVLKKYRRDNGEKEEPKPEGYDIVNISTAKFVKPSGSKEIEIEVIDFKTDEDKGER